MTEFLNPLALKDGDWTITVHTGGHAYLSRENPNRTVSLSGGGVLASALDNVEMPQATEKQLAFWNEKRKQLTEFDKVWALTFPAK